MSFDPEPPALALREAQGYKVHDDLGRTRLLVVIGVAVCGSASAFNYVADANSTYWGIQDAAPPRVDTGSIRATQVGAGQNPAREHEDPVPGLPDAGIADVNTVANELAHRVAEGFLEPEQQPRGAGDPLEAGQCLDREEPEPVRDPREPGGGDDGGGERAAGHRGAGGDPPAESPAKTEPASTASSG